MPKYAYNDDDQESQDSDKRGLDVIRNWLAASMLFLRVKKFTQKHAEAVDRRKEEKQIEAQTKAEYLKTYNQRREEHYAKFQSKKKQEKEAKTKDSEVDIQKLSQSWLEEYKHPSSTANVSIHETIGDNNESKVDISRVTLDTSVFDLSFDLSTSFNSTAKSVFSSEIVSGTTQSSPRFPLDKLEAYTGARPSFGGATVTSTPVAKLFNPLPVLKETSISVPPPQPSNINVSTPKAMSPAREPLSAAPETPKLTLEKTNISMESIELEPNTPKAFKQLLESQLASTLRKYYSQDLDKKEENGICSERFVKSGDTALRGNIKRTIYDKLGVCSKKHATSSDLNPVILLFTNLLNGKPVESHTGHKIQIQEESALAYTYDAIITYCLGIVGRDGDLVYVIASILRGICRQCLSFESVLFGHLFTESALLSLDPSNSRTFAEKLIAEPTQRSNMHAKERNIINLFFALHLNPKDESSDKSRLNLCNLWRVMAVILNTPPCVISTAVLCTSFLQICTDKMRIIYPKQWLKIVEIFKKELTLLEETLQSSELARDAGEASTLSVFRNHIENL